MIERFCKDCAHFHVHLTGPASLGECRRTRQVVRSPVTGKRIGGGRYADVERVGYDPAHCGPDAKYWAPRPTPWWRRLFR